MTLIEQRRTNMLMWSMLLQKLDPVLSWCFLLEWARLAP